MSSTQIPERRSWSRQLGSKHYHFRLDKGQQNELKLRWWILDTIALDWVEQNERTFRNWRLCKRFISELPTN